MVRRLTFLCSSLKCTRLESTGIDVTREPKRNEKPEHRARTWVYFEAVKKVDGPLWTFAWSLAGRWNK